MKAVVFVNILSVFLKLADHVTYSWTKFASLGDFLAPTGTNKSARSHVQCGIKCTNEFGCKSFFFTSGQLVYNCHLHVNVFLSSSGMIRTPNVEYFIPGSFSQFTFELLPTPANYSFPTSSTSSNLLTSQSSTASLCHLKDDQYHSVTLTDSSTFTFKFHEVQLIYDKAVSTCASESGHLVKITTSAKLEMLREILLCEGFTSSDYVFVDGVYDAGTWYFNDEDIAAFPASFWGSGFPNKEESHKCTQLVKDSNWYAENWDCSDYEDPFICEK